MTLGPWLTLGLVLTPLALLAVALRRPRYVLAQPAYTRWLLRPWRLLTFLPALVGIVVIAPYTGDPYWDAVDASVMALATFATAPWAVGSFWRWQTTRIDELAAAVVLMLFSASWSYDGWILLRDGVLPLTSLDNLLASTCLYLFAGFFWNLDGRDGRADWAPRRAAWPEVEAGGFRAVWPLAGVVMVFIALLMLSSVFGWV